MHTTMTAPEAPKNDAVVRPKHYQSAGSLECWDVIEQFDLGYHLGNAFKYMVRHKKKGRPLEDMKKCKAFVDRYIELMTRYQEPA